MKAVKTHVGRCDSCGEPAAYAQLLPGGRKFLFCEQHVPLLVKKQAVQSSSRKSVTPLNDFTTDVHKVPSRATGRFGEKIKGFRR